MTKIISNKSNVDLDYPVVRPSLDLDFTQEELDPRITFSRGSIGTRVNRNRLIETVAANQPRFDYDPVTGECKGLLIEESRINSLLYSQDFSNASWIISGLSFSYNNVIGLDGTTTASTFTAISTNTLNAIYQNFTCTASTTYTFSFYVKLGTLPVSSYKIAVYNNTALSFIAADVVPTQTLSSNSWTRVSYTFTTPVGCVSARVYPYRNDNRTQNNGTFYLWGAQLETGSFPTSYIPTSASTVTRSAELAEMTGTNFSSWYNQTEGTFVFDGTLPFITNDTVGRVPYGVSNGFNFSNSMYVAKTSTSLALSFSIINNNVAQTTGTSLPNMTSSRFKVASAVADKNIYSCGYGGTVNKHSRPSAAIPTVNRLTLGREPWNGSALNPIIGHITRFTYYPRALKPNQLQYLTQ
jgi:hypothetical protein